MPMKNPSATTANHQNYPNLIDISPLVSENIGVFPGDTPFQRSIPWTYSKGNFLEVSSIQTTLHVGAHVDSPVHYDPKGEKMHERSLHYYLGPCQVVSVSSSRDARILPSEVSTEIKAPRVLFKTGSFPNPEQWNNDFRSLSPELVDFLHERGVILVGIDTPSIDPCFDEKLLSHHAIYKNNMAILEGIVLTEVPDGIYDLIALPLNLKNADASPVRAVLLDVNSLWNPKR